MGKSPQCPQTAWIRAPRVWVGYWSLDEGDGQVVSDESPAGNDGFLGESSGADGADPRWVTP